MIVNSRPFSAVSSVSIANIVKNANGAGEFREINDDQLLALTGQKPVILIRTGPDSEELVFVNPADRRGFPVN